MARVRLLEERVWAFKGVPRGVKVEVEEKMISPEKIERWANQTENMLSTLVEAGLGADARTVEKVEACIDQLAEARQFAGKGHLSTAAACLSRADLELHNAFRAKGLLWRFNRYFPWIFIYLVIALFMVLNAATGWRPSGLEWIPPLADKVWGVPVAVMGWGALGGILRSLYWSHRQVGNRMYRDSFTLFHLSSPLISALFGAVVYLVLAGGLVILEGDGNIDLENNAFVYATALICGFQWKSLLEWLSSYRFGSRAGRAADEETIK